MALASSRSHTYPRPGAGTLTRPYCLGTIFQRHRPHAQLPAINFPIPLTLSSSYLAHGRVGRGSLFKLINRTQSSLLKHYPDYPQGFTAPTSQPPSMSSRYIQRFCGSPRNSR